MLDSRFAYAEHPNLQFIAANHHGLPAGPRRVRLSVNLGQEALQHRGSQTALNHRIPCRLQRRRPLGGAENDCLQKSRRLLTSYLAPLSKPVRYVFQILCEQAELRARAGDLKSAKPISTKLDHDARVWLTLRISRGAPLRAVGCMRLFGGLPSTVSALLRRQPRRLRKNRPVSMSCPAPTVRRRGRGGRTPSARIPRR